MNHQPEPLAITLSISAVERDTGLSKDTLRVWERRYGFPLPERDAFGERAYPLAQLEKLRVVKRLLDAGHRPGTIVPKGIEVLRSLITNPAQAKPQAPSPHRGDLQTYLQLVRSHDADALQKALAQATLDLGLAAFVCDVVAPLTVLVGEGWMRGELQVFEEHLYTESVQAVLHQAMIGLRSPAANARPRVLLTSFPNEHHALGLLVAQVMLRLHGCHCLSLGTQTPIADMVKAAAALRSDIVALNFTASLNSKHVTHGLAQLRQLLPAHVSVWAGGQCPVLDRKSLTGITRVASLQNILGVVARWHESHVVA